MSNDYWVMMILFPNGKKVIYEIKNVCDSDRKPIFHFLDSPVPIKNEYRYLYFVYDLQAV
jgi:hypothetical protein